MAAAPRRSFASIGASTDEMSPRAPSDWLEFRERQRLRNVIEEDPDRHADSRLHAIRKSYLREHVKAFVECDDAENARQLSRTLAMQWYVLQRERIDRAAAFRNLPVEIDAEAIGAERARMKDGFAAIPATLETQLVA